MIFPENTDYYRSYAPLFGKLAKELTRQEARADFNHMMEHRGERWEELRSFFEDDRIRPDMSDELVQELDSWFQRSVELIPPGEPNPYAPEPRLQSVWFCFSYDFAIMLGDIAIYRNPHLKWSLSRSRAKRSADYNEPVILGFRNAPDDGFEYCCKGVTAAHGHRAVDNEADPDEFVQILAQLNAIA